MHFPYALRAPLRYARFRGAALKATLKASLGKVETPDGLPLPPPNLRQRVHGNFEAASFLRVSKRVADDVRKLFSSVGYDLDSFERVLDLGCGRDDYCASLAIWRASYTEPTSTLKR
jgi:hypothetical protein